MAKIKFSADRVISVDRVISAKGDCYAVTAFIEGVGNVESFYMRINDEDVAENIADVANKAVEFAENVDVEVCAGEESDGTPTLYVDFQDGVYSCRFDDKWLAQDAATFINRVFETAAQIDAKNDTQN